MGNWRRRGSGEWGNGGEGRDKERGDGITGKGGLEEVHEQQIKLQFFSHTAFIHYTVRVSCPLFRLHFLPYFFTVCRNRTKILNSEHNPTLYGFFTG